MGKPLSLPIGRRPLCSLKNVQAPRVVAQFAPFERSVERLTGQHGMNSISSGVPVANIDPMGPPLGPVEKFIALYDCESRTEEDLSLAKGDGIIIVDNQDNRRWKARCVSSGKEGYISSNYVAPLESIRSRK